MIPRIHHRRKGPGLMFAALVGLGVVSAMGGALAALTASNDIDACVKRDTAQVYIIGQGSRLNECEPNDVPISWGIQGPRALVARRELPGPSAAASPVATVSTRSR